MRTEDGYIIYRCLNGDSAAFGLLVDKYKAGVYALAYEKLHNFHDAEDIAQEVFLKAYRSLRTLRRWDSFASWLYRITFNLCKNWIRAQYRRPDHEFIEDQEQEILDAPSKDSYRQNLVFESVREAIDSLPEMHRQVLTLHYLGGMTSAEIARFVGTSPAAVRMRLGKARSLLKDEMLATTGTVFDNQKLDASFTLRVVEALKRIRFEPVSRTTGLPWGLSLATGIIITVLSVGSHLGISSSMDIPRDLPMPSRLIKEGEVPVDIFNVHQIPALASEQGDSDRGKSELPASQTVASAEGVMIDPRTGARYIRSSTFTGKRDVIEHVGWPLALELSPNGKFLLWGHLVVPLDGGEPFRLIDRDTSWSYWSPDGKKVASLLEGAIWVIPVSPETGQPIGPARTFPVGEFGMPRITWSPDSESIAFEKWNEETHSDIWILSVRDGSLTQITDVPGRENFPAWSTDGKTIAYAEDGVWLVSAEGGTARKISARRGHVSWSPDSSGIFIYSQEPSLDKAKLRFLRFADGREFDITPPAEVGTHFACSPDGRKMLFYRSSYDWRSVPKVVSASGGSSFEPGRELKLSPHDQLWSPDSRSIIMWGQGKDDYWRLWVIPLAGTEPFPLELDVSVPAKAYPWSVSPGCGKLLFTVEQSDNTKDLWVAPVSLKDGRTTNASVMVFSCQEGEFPGDIAWSPDATKIAMIYKDDIWIVPAGGGEPVQITRDAGSKRWPVFSPDSRTIAYTDYRPGGEMAFMLISASGGEAREVSAGNFGNWRKYAWSPDGKEFTFLSRGGIWAVSTAGGEARQIADLGSLGLDGPKFTAHPCWSPDGQNLAFAGRKGNWKIFMIPAEGSEITELATDDPNLKLCLFWSPDGKWISYNSDGFVKTRPEGEIWEVDVSELLKAGGL